MTNKSKIEQNTEKRNYLKSLEETTNQNHFTVISREAGLLWDNYPRTSDL